MALYLFTKAQFENRCSAKKVARLYDDDGTGAANANPVSQLRADASSKVLIYLQPMGITPKIEALYNLTTGELLDATKGLPPELVRLSLDVAVAFACQRHPEIFRQDWQALMKQAEKELCDLRDGKTSLGAGWTATDPVPEDQLSGGAVGIPGQNPQASDSKSLGQCLPEGHWSKMGDFG